MSFDLCSTCSWFALHDDPQEAGQTRADGILEQTMEWVSGMDGIEALVSKLASKLLTLGIRVHLPSYLAWSISLACFPTISQHHHLC